MNTSAYLLTLALMLSACGQSQHISNPYFLETVSPSGANVVHIREILTPDGLFTHEVFLSRPSFPDQNGKITSVRIYEGDEYDERFGVLFRLQEWQSESVLRLHRPPVKKNEGLFDRILVQNRSGKAIRFLMLETLDEVLIFDLAAEASVEVKTATQTGMGDSSYIGVKWQYTDGSQLFNEGRNFPISRVPCSDAYRVLIHSDSVEIKRGEAP